MASVQPEHFVAMKAMKLGKVKHFAGYLNKWFDCFNTRHLDEAKQKRNSDLMAYTRIDDDRIQVRKSLLLPRIDNIIILVAEQRLLRLH